MNEWPEGWFRGGQGPDGPEPSGADARASKRGVWPDQPPVSSRGGLATPSRSPGYPAVQPSWQGPSRGRRWTRRIFGIIALLIVLALVGSVATYFYLNSKLTRSNILLDYPGRPAVGVGTNWLIAGSDTRQGLTRQQELQYSTGQLDATGYGRSDTIMILHIPAGGGRPVLVSIPRDSYVFIPGHGRNKINAAYAFGGPALLAQTIQTDTGLHINHYMNIGFGGFVNLVNAVGGVRMCLPAPIHDQASGLNLNAGCQVLNGGQALAWVRDRHSFATSDLQREQDQRLFLAALLKKMTSTGVVLNPFASLPAASGVASNMTVDQATQLYQLWFAARALRDPLTTTVPNSSGGYVSNVGDVLVWNHSQASQLFTALQEDQPVPANLITGSNLPA
jgi:LCP family protein required for cell wall assembly